MGLGRLLKRLARRLGYVREPGLQTVPAVPPPASGDGEPVLAHMLWVHGELSPPERLAAASFVVNGFRLKLWSYDRVTNLPRGVELCDAREIVPESRVFTYGNGSYAGFADLFRYSVLCREGGLWADTDVICLVNASALRALGDNGFLVSERTRGGSVQINVNVIHHPSPAPGDLIDLARVVAERFPVDTMVWGDIGPKLATTLVKAYPRLAPPIMAPDFANPVDWWECPRRLLSASTRLPSEAWFLHAYNETWRRAGQDKSPPYPAGSVLAEVFARYQAYL